MSSGFKTHHIKWLNLHWTGPVKYIQTQSNLGELPIPLNWNLVHLSCWFKLNSGIDNSLSTGSDKWNFKSHCKADHFQPGSCFPVFLCLFMSLNPGVFSDLQGHCTKIKPKIMYSLCNDKCNYNNYDIVWITLHVWVLQYLHVRINFLLASHLPVLNVSLQATRTFFLLTQETRFFDFLFFFNSAVSMLRNGIKRWSSFQI